MKNNNRIKGFALFSLLGVGLFLLIILLQAASDNNISVNNLTVANITDTAATVVWTSDQPYVSKVVYKKESENWLPIFGQLGKPQTGDDRDSMLTSEGSYREVDGGPKTRYTHIVTIKNLTPNTSYDFRIAGAISGKD